MVKRSRSMSLATAIAATAAIFFNIAATAADTKLIPIADFVRDSVYAAPRLSPDGKHLAVSVRGVQKEEEGLHLFTIYELATMKPVTTMLMQKYELPANIHWITNTRVLIEVAKDLGWRTAPFRTGELMALNLDGTKQDYLYGYQMFKRSKKGYSGMDDYGAAYFKAVPQERNGRFFMTEYQWKDTNDRTYLYDINSITSSRKLVTQVSMPNFNFLLNREDKPVFAFGVNDDDEYILKRIDTKGDWVDVEHKTRKEFLRPLVFAADDKSFYARFSKSGEPGSLVRQATASGERTILASDPVGDIDRLQYSASPRVPFAAGTSIGIPSVKYLVEDGADAKLHKVLSKSFLGQIVRFSSFSEDGNKILLFVESDKNPGDYYLMDRTTSKADHLFALRPWVDPDMMAERRPIQFKARNGTELYGYFTMPPGKGDKKLPMVLIPHGGPFGVDDNWVYNDDAQFLANRGYLVLQVNFRGSGGRGLSFEESGHRQWGTGIQEDLIDGVRWAIEQGAADPARICVYGGSFGGYSAMMSVVRAPGLFKCAVGLAGVYDLPMFVKDDTQVGNKHRSNFFGKTIVTDKAELEANSPTRFADKIDIPVFLAHGEKDKNVLPEQAEAMHAALNKAGKKHEWMMVPKEGHGFYAEKNRIAFYEKLEAFLGQHIGK